jgi:hypothetical protein
VIKHGKDQILAAIRSAAFARLRRIGIENITAGREGNVEELKQPLHLILGRTERPGGNAISIVTFYGLRV